MQAVCASHRRTWGKVRANDAEKPHGIGPEADGAERDRLRRTEKQHVCLRRATSNIGAAHIVYHSYLCARDMNIVPIVTTYPAHTIRSVIGTISFIAGHVAPAILAIRSNQSPIRNRSQLGWKWGKCAKIQCEAQVNYGRN